MPMSTASPFDRLPLEIVYAILRRAARDAVVRNPSWIAQLSLTSRGTHAAVIPILYETIFLTPKTCDALLRPAYVKACRPNPLHGVRRVWVDKSLDDFDQVLKVLSVCVNLETLDASLELLIALQPDVVPPRRIALRFRALHALTRLPADVGASLTHLEAYHFPDTNAAADDRAWLRGILDMLPSLTHVALNIAQAGMPGPRTVLWPEQLDDIAACARTILSHKPIQRVLVHVSGVYTVEWLQIESRLRQLGDSRLFGWNDTRYYLNWNEEERLCALDVRSGVDVWAGGVPMWSS
ncbi:hypothetical protein AURDEDRAFT_154404 [Auricularia subglabra TFB-10046 SS5]|nr:hypothetical protein AURDEDRAFT_154404 [Auricularia subglabra TFB-10046 SS5]